MPLIQSTYQPPWYLRNADLHTIISPVFRKVKGVKYVRERITTPDDDFLAIDWLNENSNKVVLLLHGLEASSESAYIKGMAKKLFANGYSVAALNLRGCSGEMNKQLRAYHSGATDDIETVVNHILNRSDSTELFIAGFSLGGNLALKYLGEKGNKISRQIKKAIAFSVPCDLGACADTLDYSAKFIYKKRFLKTLKSKAAARIHEHHFKNSEQKILSAKTLREYDDLFTAPLYNFKNAEDYYQKCSSKQFIKNISIPTLIINSKDDPFFNEQCLPVEECRIHKLVYLEATDYGGHVGFISNVFKWDYFSESRTLKWFSK